MEISQSPIPPCKALAPRPTPELRRALFGRVSIDRPPPLRSIELFYEATDFEDTIVFQCHPLAWAPINQLFHEWFMSGLSKYVLSVDRVYEARFSPEGRPLTHAHGNAFDINGTWNQLTKPAAREGEPGHIPEALFDIARRRGFWCGTDWLNPAHKHFELTRLP
jgi:hypothetical protein